MLELNCYSKLYIPFFCRLLLVSVTLLSIYSIYLLLVCSKETGNLRCYYTIRIIPVECKEKEVKSAQIRPGAVCKSEFLSLC